MTKEQKMYKTYAAKTTRELNRAYGSAIASARLDVSSLGACDENDLTTAESLVGYLEMAGVIAEVLEDRMLADIAERRKALAATTAKR